MSGTHTVVRKRDATGHLQFTFVEFPSSMLVQGMSAAARRPQFQGHAIVQAMLVYGRDIPSIAYDPPRPSHPCTLPALSCCLIAEDVRAAFVAFCSFGTRQVRASVCKTGAGASHTGGPLNVPRWGVRLPSGGNARLCKALAGLFRCEHTPAHRRSMHCRHVQQHI